MGQPAQSTPSQTQTLPGNPITPTGSSAPARAVRCMTATAASLRATNRGWWPKARMLDAPSNASLKPA